MQSGARPQSPPQARYFSPQALCLVLGLRVGTPVGDFSRWCEGEDPQPGLSLNAKGGYGVRGQKWVGTPPSVGPEAVALDYTIKWNRNTKVLDFVQFGRPNGTVHSTTFELVVAL